MKHIDQDQELLFKLNDWMYWRIVFPVIWTTKCDELKMLKRRIIHYDFQYDSG